MMLQAYKTGIDEAEKEKILNELLPFIKYTAYRLSWRLPPQLTVDDLISVGVIGLLDAIERYDPSKQANIKTFAEYRIRGAMLDELRAADWTPKHLQKKINTIKNAYSELQQKLGRQPTEEEVADELEIEIGELQSLLEKAHRSISISLDEISSKVDDRGDGNYDIHEHLSDDTSLNPLELLEREDAKEHLKRAIESLPEREKLILSLYYWEELTFKEIGAVLNVSESRVSQLHSQALLRLKAEMEKES